MVTFDAGSIEASRLSKLVIYITERMYQDMTKTIDVLLTR